MKEHVLWHLDVDPPKRINIHARVRYLPEGGFRIMKDYSNGNEDEVEAGQGDGDIAMVAEGSSNMGEVAVADEVDRFRISGEQSSVAYQHWELSSYEYYLTDLMFRYHTRSCIASWQRDHYYDYDDHDRRNDLPTFTNIPIFSIPTRPT